MPSFHTFFSIRLSAGASGAPRHVWVENGNLSNSSDRHLVWGPTLWCSFRRGDLAVTAECRCKNRSRQREKDPHSQLRPATR